MIIAYPHLAFPSYILVYLLYDTIGDLGTQAIAKEFLIACKGSARLMEVIPLIKPKRFQGLSIILAAITVLASSCLHLGSFLATSFPKLFC